MLNLNVVTPKGTSLRETASYEPSCIKISSVVFSCRGRQEKKGRKGKAQKVTQALYFTYSWGSPRKRIFTKFCTSGDMLDIIICANFGVEKLRGLGNMRGQILEFSIEMAGHPYNRAGATAQPVMYTVTAITCMCKMSVLQYAMPNKLI